MRITALVIVDNSVQHLNVKFEQIQELVEDFANGGYQDYRAKFARSLHYHAYYVSPNWPLNRLARVGAHIFYD